MAELKTKPSDASVERFVAAIRDEARRADCRALLRLMKGATGSPPRMWGSSVVGFGDYHYRYASGREGDWFLTGFSPRKQDLTLYIMGGFENHRDLMEKLGKFKTGKGCLYLKRLDDVHLPTLKKLIRRSVKQTAKPPSGD
jgi:hypothetical protein